LLAIDAFSQHIWCTTIRNKSGPTIKKALETVFDSIQHPVKTVTASISEVSSDQEKNGFIPQFNNRPLCYLGFISSVQLDFYMYSLLIVGFIQTLLLGNRIYCQQKLF